MLPARRKILPMKLPKFGRRRTLHEEIRRHYDNFWGADRIEEVHWTPGPIATRLPQLHMAKVAPAGPNEPWILATIGMSEVDAEHNHGIELVAMAPDAGSAAMFNLGMLAYYHAGPEENRLAHGHTVPIGQGWVEGSPLDHVLISLPYPWGPALELCEIGERLVRILWALPIHAAERRLVATEGLEALEQRLEAASINAMDPDRPSVA
jgi:Suppressor of fused protein (SUFU)